MDKCTDYGKMSGPIISSAMHDIYNEINNLFFLLEVTRLSCLCLPENKKQEINNDCFEIIGKLKAKQFLFCNLFSEKMFSAEDFEKQVNILNTVECTNNAEFPLSLLCIIFLLSDDKSTIKFKNNNIVFKAKKKFLSYLVSNQDFEESAGLSSEKESWLEQLFIENLKMNKFLYRINYSYVEEALAQNPDIIVYKE